MNLIAAAQFDTYSVSHMRTLQMQLYLYFQINVRYQSVGEQAADFSISIRFAGLYIAMVGHIFGRKAISVQ